MFAGQNFRLVPSSANIPATPRPTPRPHAKPRPRPRPSPRPAKVGTNKDQDKHHNCCGGGGSCGWHWCEYSKSCKQVWEECSKDDKPTRGDDRDKHGCKVSTGEYWDGSKCANVRGD